MSTRSAITTLVDGEFRGVYHHFDGYPTGLGKTLLRLHQLSFREDLDLMTKTLITDHPAGWSNLIISGPSGHVWPLDAFASAGYYRTTNTAPRCYCHGDMHDEPNPITCLGSRCAGDDDGQCSPTHMEWLYVLTPAHLGVWDSRASNGAFRHHHVADIPWNVDPEVMEDIEEMARASKATAGL